MPAWRPRRRPGRPRVTAFSLLSRRHALKVVVEGRDGREAELRRRLRGRQESHRISVRRVSEGGTRRIIEQGFLLERRLFKDSPPRLALEIATTAKCKLRHGGPSPPFRADYRARAGHSQYTELRRRTSHREAEAVGAWRRCQTDERTVAAGSRESHLRPSRRRLRSTRTATL